MGLFCREDRMLAHDRSWSYFDMIPDSDCDGQTDGRTEPIIASTALSIAGYADVL